MVSIKTDPTVDPEPACVAIQIGTNLLMDMAEVLEKNVYLLAPAEVTLFIATGGAVDVHTLFMEADKVIDFRVS